MIGHKQGLNHYFRVLWNDGLQCWVAAPEKAKGKHKSSKANVKTTALAAAFMLGSLAAASTMAQTTVVENLYYDSTGIYWQRVNTPYLVTDQGANTPTIGAELSSAGVIFDAPLSVIREKTVPAVYVHSDSNLTVNDTFNVRSAGDALLVGGNGTKGTVYVNSAGPIEVVAERGYGIWAQDESIVSLRNTDNATGISITSNEAAAIAATGGSRVTLNSANNQIYTSESHAVVAGDANSNGGVYIYGATSIRTDGNGAFGILAYRNSQIRVDGNLFIETAGDGAYGIAAHGLGIGGANDVNGNLISVNTYGDWAYGASVSGNSGLFFHGASSLITTYGIGSHGVVAGDPVDGGLLSTTNGSFGNTSLLEITTYGDYAIGILSINRGQVLAHGPIQVNTSGYAAHGISAIGGDAGYSYVSMFSDEATSLHIQTTGDDAVGIQVQDGSWLSLKNEVSIVTQGSGAHGLELSAAHMRSESYRGSLSMEIETAQADAMGIYVGNGSTMSVNEANTSTRVTAAGGANAIRYDGSNNRVLLNNATLSNADSAVNALLHSDDISNTLTLTNSTALTAGELISGSAMTLNADNTQLAGSVNNAGIMRLNNASSWDMHRSSALDTLEVSADSRVNLRSSTPGAYNTLAVNTLDGTGGTFLMNVDMGARRGDLLASHEITGGAYVLDIANNGAAMTNGTEVLTVVQANANGASHSLANPVEAGGYVYNLRQQQGSNNYELYGPVEYVAPSPEPPGITTTANAAASTLKTGYLLTYVDTQTLLQRMGELRNTPGHQGDFWVRGFTGTLDSFGSGKLSGFEMDYDGMQAGIDRQFDLASGKLYVGVMGGYTHGSPGYDNNAGSGTVKGTHAGAYGTYRHEGTGIYVDGIIKYNRLKHEFSVRDTAGAGVTGSGTSHGYTVSVEAGKRFHPIAATPAFYLEPQVQLSYNRQSGTDIYASNGLHVNMDNYSSVQGRTSLIIGYRIDDEKNPVDLYAKTGYTREFRDNSAYYLNGSRETNEFGGGWVDLGLGVSATINNRHHIFGEFNFSQGSQFDRRQFNLGYRYQF